MEWTNDIVLEFLDLYENEPVIWMPKHKDHKNRSAVHDAWRRIQDNMSLQCSVHELKKKKDSLMATFRPIYKKVKATSGTESGLIDVCRPTWFAFEKMARFLHGIVCEPRNTLNTEEFENFYATEDDDTENIYEDAKPLVTLTTLDDTHEESNEEDIPSETSQAEFSPGTHTARNRKRKAVDVVERRMEDAYKIFKTAVNTEKPKRSLCRVYGQLVAEKLELLDERDRIVAMNDIDNLLFRATLRHIEQRSENL